MRGALGFTIPHVVSAGGFVPTDIAGLIGWYDASDAGTITETGGAVSQWDDKSSAGDNLTAAGGAEPTTGTRTINGLNALDFQTSEVMRNASFTSASDWTVFAVASADSTAGSYSEIFSSNGGDFEVAFHSSAKWNWWAGTDSLSTATYAADVPYVIEATHTNGGTDTLDINGTNVISASRNANIGATFAVGGYHGGGSSWLNGKMGEVVVYNSVLSSGDRDLVREYLTAKWIPVPLRISGLVAWYDASDTATITESGGAVSQLNDKSGNGFHLTQGTGAVQPTTGTRSIGGLNVLDCADDYLSRTAGSAIIGASTGFSMFIVADPDVLDGMVLAFRDSADGDPLATIAAHSFFGEWALFRDSASAGLVDAGPNAATGAHLVIFEWDGTTGAGGLTCEANGNLTSSDTAPGDLTANMNQIWFGADQGGGTTFDGGLGEAFITDGKASAGDRADAKTYLYDKWGFSF
jgi:hypothetical protein